MKCDTAREMMFDFFDCGEIDSGLKTHLDTCESCRGEFETLKQGTASLIPSVKLDIADGFTSRVMEQIGSGEEAIPIRSKPFSSTLAKAIAIAATLLIVFNLPILDMFRNDSGLSDDEKREAFSLLSSAFAAESTYLSEGIIYWEVRKEIIPRHETDFTVYPFDSPRVHQGERASICYEHDIDKENLVLYIKTWYDNHSGQFARLIDEENGATVFASCFDGSSFHFLERDIDGTYKAHQLKKNEDTRDYMDRYMIRGITTGLTYDQLERFEKKIKKNPSSYRKANHITTDENDDFLKVSYDFADEDDPNGGNMTFHVRESDSVIVYGELNPPSYLSEIISLISRTKLFSTDEAPFELSKLESLADFSTPNHAFVWRGNDFPVR